jgi:hypothetical protein
MGTNTLGASAISRSNSTLSLLLRHQNRLADVMFGDESDEDAKGAKKEYTFKPKARGGQKDSDDDDDDDNDDDDDANS